MIRCKIDGRHTRGVFRIKGFSSFINGCCPEYDENIQKIIDEHLLTHDDIDYFDYCPYCGVKNELKLFKTYNK